MVTVVAVVSGGGGVAVAVNCPGELAGGITHTTACLIEQATKDITASIVIY